MSFWTPPAAHPAATLERAAALAMATSEPGFGVQAKMAAFFHALAADAKTQVTAEMPECPDCLDGCGGHDAVWHHTVCARDFEDCTCPLAAFTAAAQTFIDYHED